MPPRSDLVLDYSKFNPKLFDNETTEFNKKLMDMSTKGPKWYEVGAARYREMRAQGETPIPKPVLLENARTGSAPSRESGRRIPFRYFEPENQRPEGIYLHFHGGCWTMQTEAHQDVMLNQIAQAVNLVVISVGYRLAPENPFPKGPEDCYDVAEWLVDNGKSNFHADLSFCGGESAGGHLVAMTTFHLAKARPDFKFKGLVLNCGVFDLSMTPSNYHLRKSNVLVLDLDLMQHYYEVVLPGVSIGDRKNPSISPLFQDLREIATLPSALFTCGTEDMLLDDSVFMCAKWQMAGAEAILRIYPGAPHGCILFPEGSIPSAKEGMDDVIEYLRCKLQ